VSGFANAGAIAVPGLIVDQRIEGGFDLVGAFLPVGGGC
jgi:hypothetical protein